MQINPVLEGQITDVLGKLNASQREKLADILTRPNSMMSVSERILERIYPPDDDSQNAQEFRNFFANSQIVYIGGGNSKNYEIRDEHGHSCVLKNEWRMGNNDFAAVDKVGQAVSGLVTQTPLRLETEAYIEAEDDYDKVFLTVTEYCTGSDLSSLAMKKLAKDDSQRLAQAADIFNQMGSALAVMQANEVAHPDGKNSNWILEDGKLRIADTKAFIPTHEGVFSYESLDVHGIDGITTTEGFTCPEIAEEDGALDNDEDIKADNMHAYTLGRNLYQFITCIEEGKMADEPSPPSFTHPAFETPLGKQYKSLIEQLVVEDPKQRLSVEDACKSLQQIQKQQSVKKNLEELSGEKLDDRKEGQVLVTGLKTKDEADKLAAKFQAMFNQGESSIGVVKSNDKTLTGEQQYRVIFANPEHVLNGYDKQQAYQHADPSGQAVGGREKDPEMQQVARATPEQQQLLSALSGQKLSTEGAQLVSPEFSSEAEAQVVLDDMVSRFGDEGNIVLEEEDNTFRVVIINPAEAITSYNQLKQAASVANPSDGVSGYGQDRAANPVFKKPEQTAPSPVKPESKWAKPEFSQPKAESKPAQPAPQDGVKPAASKWAKPEFSKTQREPTQAKIGTRTANKWEKAKQPSKSAAVSKFKSFKDKFKQKIGGHRTAPSNDSPSGPKM